MPESVETRQYFDVFDPPKSYLALSEAGIPQSEIDQAVVERCRSDYRREHSEELTLHRVLLSGDGVVEFYVFDVDYHDDEIVAYTVERDTKTILYKFYVPAS